MTIDEASRQPANVLPFHGVIRADLPPDQIDSYETVLELIRSERAVTRPDIAKLSGLGRSIVAERVEQAIARGLVVESDLAPSSRGRTPRSLQFAADRAHILVGSFGALGLGVAVTDLRGDILTSVHTAWTIDAGPEASLKKLCEVFDELRSGVPDRELWGIAVGLPGPVEFATGRPVMPPIMPGWHDFDVRGYLTDIYRAPVWVDNDANLMALGQLTAASLPRTTNMLFLKVGAGIGAGLISDGHLHRGGNGSAGDIGHVPVAGREDVVCRCGRRGCLEAIAGGWALTRDGTRLARSGESAYLEARLKEAGVVRGLDVLNGATRGDAACAELVRAAAQLIGEQVAGLVSFFNPSVVALGGALATTGDAFLSTVQQTIFSRALYLATRDLQVMASSDNAVLGLRGGAELVIGELFGERKVRRWFAQGSPLSDVDEVHRVRDVASA